MRMASFIVHNWKIGVYDRLERSILGRFFFLNMRNSA